MTRELKHSEHPEDSERDEGAAEVLVVGHHETDVVRQDGDDVNDAHDARHVAAALGRRKQSQQVLDGEDDDARRIQAEELQSVSWRQEPQTV